MATRDTITGGGGEGVSPSLPLASTMAAAAADTEGPESPTNSECEKLVRRRIAKSFAVDGEMKIFKGSITNYNPTHQFWSISYDDGDSEEMEWKELQVALKLYVDMQVGGSAGTHAAAGSTPPPSTATTSTCVKPKTTKKSQDSTASSKVAKQFAAATTLMQNSEDVAKQILSTATKNRKDIQAQVNHAEQEVASAKKVLEEAQQRLAAVSKTLATAKLEEETAKKVLSTATKAREDIQGLADSTLEPKKLFKEDDISTDGEDTDNDKKKASVVTPPKKKRRKVVKLTPLSDTEKGIIKNKMEGETYLGKFEVSTCLSGIVYPF